MTSKRMATFVWGTLVAVAVWSRNGTATACVAPQGFTPDHLVEQSDGIWLVRAERAGRAGGVRLRVLRTLRGRKLAKSRRLDFSTAHKASEAKRLKALIDGNAGGPAILAVGRGADSEKVSFLHVGGRWVGLKSGRGGDSWQVTGINDRMEETWAGGTDMLVRLVDLICRCPEVSVPVSSGVAWEDQMKLGRIEGRVSGARAVDLAGTGRNLLYLASEKGDRLLEYVMRDSGGKFRDVTASRKLRAASRAFAWGDYDGNGRVDLASWDGTRISLHAQKIDGTFAPGKPVRSVANCLGLTAVNTGAAGRAGLLVSGPGAPLLLVYRTRNAGFEARRLKAHAGLISAQGSLKACVVADLDCDGRIDVLQPGERGSLLYVGRAGAFAPAAECPIKAGRGAATTFVGDFDQDGRPDVVTARTDGVRVWQNYAKQGFKETISLSGEIAYISRPGASGGQACDVNSDGLQDIMLSYADRSPQIFCNRGFRSFIHAHALDIEERRLMPLADKGTQAVTVADFDGDGGQDMALVLKNGEVRLLPRRTEDTAPVAVRVLPVSGRSRATPVAVTAWQFDGKTRVRCLGSRPLVPGSAGAYFACLHGCTLKLCWRLPDGRRASRIVEVKEGTQRLSLEPPASADLREVALQSSYGSSHPDRSRAAAQRRAISSWRGSTPRQ